MNIIYTKSYLKGLKKLNKHSKEIDNLRKIIVFITNARDFNELKYLPMVKIYNFERLKYKYNDLYSFNLCKNGGKIRLIIKPNSDNEVELYFLFISFDHYTDFDLERVIYDE